MDVTRLVSMANDIAAFFDAESRETAAESVRTHLTKFWEPRMRREIAAHEAAGGAGMTPTVREAVRRLPPA